jgi:hypothetical protein
MSGDEAGGVATDGDEAINGANLEQKGCWALGSGRKWRLKDAAVEPSLWPAAQSPEPDSHSIN